MNVDRTEPAVQVYQEALDYAQNTWVDGNIKLAQAHEELAYVLYVYEYSSGGFLKARWVSWSLSCKAISKNVCFNFQRTCRESDRNLEPPSP